MHNQAVRKRLNKALRRPSLAQEISSRELASMLRFSGDSHNKRRKAVRWMKRRGVGLQDESGRWFTTLSKLREYATTEHVWQEAVRRGFGEEG